MIILIIITCLILYKTGAMSRFLASLEMDPEAIPEPVEIQEPEPQEPPEGRQKWEIEARYVLTIQGRVNPDTVAYMGDEMLKSIIRDYLDI